MFVVTTDHVRVLVRLIRSYEAVIKLVGDELLPLQLRRKLALSHFQEDIDPGPVIKAAMGIEPATYDRLDYEFSEGRLLLHLRVPFGDGVEMHGKIPAISTPDYKEGLFFPYARLVEIASATHTGMEKVTFAADLAVSWAYPDFDVDARTDWVP